MMRLFFILCIFVMTPLALQAAAPSDTFIVRQLVGSDSNPPSTPIFISATPIASSQIDLLWQPATDDIAVVAYRVYRDGIAIATTTQTSYSDSGLTASTTYSYTLDAYDYSFNISTTSLPVATTTLAISVPPVATTTPSVGNTTSTAAPFVRALTVSTTPQTATLSITTFGPTRYVVRWGRTTSYELGAISSGLYKRSHSPTIYQLEPGTVYQFELELVSDRGISEVVERGSFTTAPGFTNTAPANVSNLQATVVGDDVLLSWQLPPDMLGTVRVVRSHLFYPTSPTDGMIVYDGTGVSVSDKNAFEPHSPQYYSVFVQDPSGMVSSGAVVKVERQAVLSVRDDGFSAGTTSSMGSPDAVVPVLPITQIGDSTLLDPAAVQLRFLDTVTTLDAVYDLPTATTLTVMVPKAAVANNLKAIVLTLYNPSDHTQYTSYLLKLDPTGEYYTVSLTTSLSAGEAALVLEVYDFTAAVVRRIGTQVIYTDVPPEQDEVQAFYYDATFIGGVTLIPFCVATFFWFVWRRRHRREDKK
jgi:hypothetical protein